MNYVNLELLSSVPLFCYSSNNETFSTDKYLEEALLTKKKQILNSRKDELRYYAKSTLRKAHRKYENTFPSNVFLSSSPRFSFMNRAGTKLEEIDNLTKIVSDLYRHGQNQPELLFADLCGGPGIINILAI